MIPIVKMVRSMDPVRVMASVTGSMYAPCACLFRGEAHAHRCEALLHQGREQR
jgi:hypothetical protein